MFLLWLIKDYWKESFCRHVDPLVKKPTSQKQAIQFYVIIYFKTTMVYCCDWLQCTSHRSNAEKLHINHFKASERSLCAEKMEGTDSAWEEGHNREDLSTCWSSQEIPGHVPAVSTRKRSALSATRVVFLHYLAPKWEHECTLDCVKKKTSWCETAGVQAKPGGYNKLTKMNKQLSIFVHFPMSMWKVTFECRKIIQ